MLIAASKATFKLAESPNLDDEAMNTIRRYAADDAHVIYGTAYDESLGDQLRVTVIATGLSQPGKQRAQTPMSVVHTVVGRMNGTDGLPALHQPAHVSHAGSLGGAAGTNYANLSTPSVWRNSRTAAAKVDALASHGMDEIEIPAFLRKQAD